jgi:hypothetical protein
VPSVAELKGKIQARSASSPNRRIIPHIKHRLVFEYDVESVKNSLFYRCCG